MYVASSSPAGAPGHPLEQIRTALEDAAALVAEAARLVETLGLPGVGPSAAFRREGDFWTIAYAGVTRRVRDAKGLRYIAALLAAPCRDVYALELARAAEGISAEGRAASTAEPLLDAAAKDAYRRRLDELGESLEQARDWHDLERIAKLEQELDAVTGELARATGLGGRDRRLPTPAERARVSVTKAIRAAIKSIGRQHPSLGAHLDASIHTGRLCTYAPRGETPPRWAL